MSPGKRSTALAAREGASGSVARRGGAVVGYLLGAPRAALWGTPNIWVEGAGHAVDPADPEIVRDLYGHAAAALGRGRRDEPLRPRPGP